MKNTILIWLLLLITYTGLYSQFYNDGAEVLIENGCFVHIQGDFINQGGLITNEGRIELGGNWINTVMSNPLSQGTGVVTLLGNDQTIGGAFNTLFNDLQILNSQNVTLGATIGISDQINLGDGTLTLDRNILHILSSSSNALLSMEGGIIAETTDDYGYVRWDIGEDGSGQYAIPFENNLGTNIPVSFNVTGIQGTGPDGYLLFTTFVTDEVNNPAPIGVTNVDINGDNSGLRLVDRFWEINTIDYTVAPSISTTLIFDESNEIVNNNDIETDKLEVINWEIPSQMWLTSPRESDSSPNSVTSELIENYGSLGLWSNTTTSVDDPETLVAINLWPNPTVNELSFEVDYDKTETVQVFIFNELGELLITRNEKILSGNNLLKIDVDVLDAGAYQLYLTGETLTSSSRFVKI